MGSPLSLCISCLGKTHWGSADGLTRTARVWLAGANDVPARLGRVIELRSLLEIVLFLSAHELQHLAQYDRGERPTHRDPEQCALERAANAYGARMLCRYRRRGLPVPIGGIQEPPRNESVRKSLHAASGKTLQAPRGDACNVCYHLLDHMTDTADKELAELLARAMEQPGVADALAIFGDVRAASDAAQERMQSLQPQWTYQATNTSS